MDIFPTRSRWWKATVLDTDEGVIVELWKQADVTGNMWQRVSLETFPGPFHYVLSQTADWLDTLPVQAGSTLKE